MHPCFSHFTKLCRVLCTTSPHCIRRLHKIKEFQLKSSVHSCAAVQLCSCAVVHPQLRWILTENTFNGTQMAGLREKSVGTGNQIELLYVFFLQQIIWIHEYVWTIYSFQFQRLTTSDPWSSSSSTVFPAVQNNHKSTLTSLNRILGSLLKQCAQFEMLLHNLTLHCFSLTSDTQQVFSGGKLFAEWESH